MPAPLFVEGVIVPAADKVGPPDPL